MITSNFNSVIRDIKALRQEVSEKIVKGGMDDILEKDIASLKSELQFILSKKTEAAPVDPSRPAQESNLIQQKITLPKSKEVIIKHLTGVDINEYKNQKDKTDYYNQTSGPKLVVANPSKGQNSSSRVTLRMPIADGETVESQHQAAKRFFEKAVYAFPEGSGELSFRTSDNVGLEDNLKIKCSSYPGADDFDDYGGTSPARRFELDSQRGYAEWTLKQSYVDNIKATGLDLTKLADDIIAGDYDNAKNIAGVSKDPAAREVIEKIDQLENNAGLTPDTETTNNIIQLIKNLKIEKTMTKAGARYALVSSYGTLESVDFMAELERQISLWKNINIDSWLKALVTKITAVIKKFESR